MAASPHSRSSEAIRSIAWSYADARRSLAPLLAAVIAGCSSSSGPSPSGGAGGETGVNGDCAEETTSGSSLVDCIAEGRPVLSARFDDKYTDGSVTASGDLPLSELDGLGADLRSCLGDTRPNRPCHRAYDFSLSVEVRDCGRHTLLVGGVYPEDGFLIAGVEILGLVGPARRCFTGCAGLGRRLAPYVVPWPFGPSEEEEEEEEER